MLKSDYVDKTGMISIINSTFGTKKKLTCISRPCRFGKSYAAQMLCAYYDKTCDSHELFLSYNISEDKSYEKHLNKYISYMGNKFIMIIDEWDALIRETPEIEKNICSRNTDELYRYGLG